MIPNSNPQALSPERLAGISARVESATAGPWCTDSWEIYQGTEYAAGAEWIGETCRGSVDGTQDRADAAFIAAARTDVPALLAEVERLKAELAKYVGHEPTIAEEMAYLSGCLNAVRNLCDEAKRDGALGITIEAVEQAADGQRPDDPNDNRLRLYIDGKGFAWIDSCTDADGTQYVCQVDGAFISEGQPADSVRADTGSLREIGRTW